MENNQERKKKILNLKIYLGLFILIGMLGGVTYAFFNYTRTGDVNTVRTGQINFSTTQSTIDLDNAFPIARNAAGTDTTNTDDVVITITGNTTYSGGIEYLVSATAVENTINNKTVPISIVTSASNLGTNDEEYFDNRGSTTSVYKVLAKDTVENNEQLLVGYIPSGQQGVNGSVTIKAFLDSDLIAITDTLENGAIAETGYVNGTTSNWVAGRTVLTTEEWNSLRTNGLTFKVKVEANEGTWVEEVRSVNAMNTFPTTITDQKANIKEVYFNKMGATRMQNAYDTATIKADLTYNNEGKVLAWLETNTTDNTKYNLIVASDGDTYLTTGDQLFAGWSNINKIEFNNINTSNVETMVAMFANCSSIDGLNLSSFDTHNVTDVQNMFFNCSNLKNINLSTLNFNSITNMMSMFTNCSNLLTVNLSNLGSNNLTTIHNIFSNCSKLEELYMSNFNFGSSNNIYFLNGVNNIRVIDLSGIVANNFTSLNSWLANKNKLETVNLSGANMSNVTTLVSAFEGLTDLETLNLSGVTFGNITGLQLAFNGDSSLTELDLSGFNTNFLSQNGLASTFENCSSLERIYVSSSWDASNQINDMPIFGNNTNLVGQAPNGTSYAFTDYNTTDKTYAVIATNDTVGYLTDISLKPTA